MRQFNNGAYLIECAAELPALAGVNLFLDFETSSGSPKLDSLNPWHNCKVAGFAITVDDSPVYYVPYQHWQPCDQFICREWLDEIIVQCDNWINHNVKYDSHVAANDLFIVAMFCNLVCTLTLSKLLDSDRIMRGGYSLDALALGWLQEDIRYLYQSLQPYLVRNKDYGKIPPDILGEYCSGQLMANRRLWHYLCEHIPEECLGVWQTEIKLTRRLFQMERTGLRVDPMQLKQEQYKTLNRMCAIDSELAKIVGHSFRPHVNEDCYDVICNQYGLPILAYTKDQETGEETQNPSFDKYALVLYKAQPTAPIEVIGLIQEFRTLNQFNNLFLEPWQVYEKDGILHVTYNQCIRTGRMSCTEPNAQQLNEHAKQLIIPPDGCAIIAIDASQIEFRFIVHYIEDQKAITAYNENPDTDFHELAAQFCGIKRKPAKSINLGIGFGEGKKKLTKALASDPDLTAAIKEQVNAMENLTNEQRIEMFQTLAIKRALDVYNTWHDTFPTCKTTSKDVERVCKIRGYLRNMYGRHRHLPYQFAYRGFNTINQSSAADWIKERFSSLCDLLEEINAPIKPIAIVHDEIVFIAPIGVANDWRTQRDLIGFMETLVIPLRVPMRCSIGVSSKCWAEASKPAKDGGPSHTLTYDKADCRLLAHLRA